MYRSKWSKKLNEDGYTLLEVLFHFVVFLLLAQFIALLMIWINQLNAMYNKNEQIAWEMFVNDFSRNLIGIEDIVVSDDSNEIVISKQNQEGEIQINQYKEVLRKQVDRAGYVPLLIGIKKVDFSFEQNELKIGVEFLTGMKKERTFFVQLYKE